MNPRLQFRDLTIGYESEITRPLTADIGRGCSVLLGRNGVGKTTLLRTLAGVLPHFSGALEMTSKHRAAIVSHLPALAGRLTVQENLAFWANVEGLSKHVGRAAVSRAIDEGGLSDVASSRVEGLSHGQARLVDIVRAAMFSSDVLLLDEPLTGLDPVHAQAVRNLLKKRARSSIVLVSTHNIADARLMADLFLILRTDSLRSIMSGPSKLTDEYLLELMNEGER